jgi:hypothetical protein
MPNEDRNIAAISSKVSRERVFEMAVFDADTLEAGVFDEGEGVFMGGVESSGIGR